jgi:hypothetical protein
MSDLNGHANGNGNGNGHQKVFELNRTVDPDTIAVLESRRSCRADQRLNRSMKACFDEIADRALNPSCYDAKGIVTISDAGLADVFGVSERTVYTWKHQIEACGYVWLGKKFKTNMWPLTTYYLSCLHKKPALKKTDADGTYGRGRFRSGPDNPGLGARSPGQPQLPLAGSRQVNGEAKSEDLLAISAVSRKNVPLSAEENFGSEPKPASALSRNGLRLSAEENFGSEPKPTAAQSRSGTPPRAEADCRLNKAKVSGEGILEGGEGHPTPDFQFLQFKKDLKGQFPSKLRALQKDLKAKLQNARSDEARKEWKRRLEAVEEHLLGGPVKDQPTAKPKPARKAPEPLTEDEVLYSAREIIAMAKEANLKPLLTDKHRDALQRVGEL